MNAVPTEPAEAVGATTPTAPGGPDLVALAQQRRRARRRAKAASVLHSTWPLALIAVVWQTVSHLGFVPQVLTPPIEDIWQALVRLQTEGLLLQHVGATLARMLGGFAIAAVVGGVMGMTMAYWRFSERLFAPILSFLMPVPGLAWVPIFVLWFGLGNLPTVLLVAFVSTMPIASAVWTGVRSTQPVWIRAARSMGASGLFMFRKVIFPAAMPYLLSGVRIGLAQAWRSVVAGEFIAATNVGLGVLIFNSIAFLQSDVMFAGILMIALLGFFMERVVVQLIEERTVVRWGTVQKVGAR